MKKVSKSIGSRNCKGVQNWKQTSFASQYRYDTAGSRARQFQSAYLKLIGGTIFLTFVGVLFFVQIQSRLHPQQHPVTKISKSQNLSQSQNQSSGHNTPTPITCHTRTKTNTVFPKRTHHQEKRNGNELVMSGTFSKIKTLVKRFFQAPPNYKQFQYRRHRRHAEMLLSHIKMH